MLCQHWQSENISGENHICNKNEMKIYHRRDNLKEIAEAKTKPMFSNFLKLLILAVSLVFSPLIFKMTAHDFRNSSGQLTVWGSKIDCVGSERFQFSEKSR